MAASAKSTPARGLTEEKLETWARAEHRSAFVVRDRQCPGLFVRVGTTGAITFRWHAYDAQAKKHQNVRLGTYPQELRLEAARAKLKELRKAQKSDALDQVLAGDKMSVSAAGEEFLQYLAKRRRNPDDPRSSVTIARSYFERFVFTAIGTVPVAMVSVAQCRKIIEDLVTDEKPAAAGMVHQLLGQFFRWCEGKGLLRFNPARAVDREDVGAGPSSPRKRCLSVDEIGQFWRAMENDATSATRTAKLALRALLMTAVRQGELVKARWREVDLEKATWTIPPENRKMKKKQLDDARDFVVPLSPLALAVFRELKENADKHKSPWVLPSPMHGGSAPFCTLTLSTACRNFFKPRTDKPSVFAFEAFTPHDLRRTARSYFTEKLGAEPMVAERCLGHSVGGRVFQTYDTRDYLEQRRALLDKWGVYVEQLAHGDAAAVKFLTPARSAS